MKISTEYAHLGLLAACLLFGLGLQGKLLADRKEPAGTAMPIDRLTSTAWFALTDEQMNFRVKFEPNGTGLFGFQDLEAPVHLYSITKWSSSSTNIVIEVNPLGKGEPLKVEGMTGYSMLSLKVRGDGWARTLKMVNESIFERRLAAVRSKMENIQK
jgi:hypothetical protein